MDLLAATARGRNQLDVLDALHTLPTTLDSTYDTYLKRIWSQEEHEAELACKVLEWVIFAACPIKISMIQSALAMRENATAIDYRAWIESEDLLEVCLGLVNIDETTSIVRFVHHTAEDYFQNENFKPIFITWIILQKVY